MTGTGSKVTISDGDNNVIRTFMTGGNIDRVGGVFAGSSSSGWGYGDNADALLAKFADPQGLYCETNAGVELALFIADSFNNVIRKITFVTITESTAALDLSGSITKFPGDRVQVLSVGLTGDGASTLTSFTLTISGSILASHIAGVELYASSNNTFDSTDKFIGSAAAVIDGPTTITTTETISNTETFYIAVVVLSSSGIPDDGRSFTVGAATGFLVTSNGNFGTAVTASSSNKVTIDILEAVITLPAQSTGFTGSPIAASGAIATCNGQAISVTPLVAEDWVFGGIHLTGVTICSVHGVSSRWQALPGLGWRVSSLVSNRCGLPGLPRMAAVARRLRLSELRPRRRLALGRWPLHVSGVFDTQFGDGRYDLRSDADTLDDMVHRLLAVRHR